MESERRECQIMPGTAPNWNPPSLFPTRDGDFQICAVGIGIGSRNLSVEGRLSRCVPLRVKAEGPGG
jgi:hypothetical protein